MEDQARNRKNQADTAGSRTVVDNVDCIADIPREYANPLILAPVVGQSFKTERDVFNFYVYAVSKGFGIRLSKDRLNSDKNKTMREICCSHEILCWDDYYAKE
ncbi:hypothetical protein E2562_009291 [Oryza meyeriana var. granulata]|uniref:Uncharacterized protein n=1 Tax=Oryza meyeriana var. granulata TaxID=110450 RepID=A0A6G1E9U3_9ORYZ|nr:hypothetical protein E2562_009291 [Oryza meyeriana var. granulata]